MLSGRNVETYQENKLTRNSSENTWPQLSQLAEPLWTDPGLKSGIGVCELVPAGSESSPLLPNPRRGGKGHCHTIIKPNEK